MPSKSGYKLVIVESPTKARTIRKFLGGDFVVEASMGHVRDLPAKASELPAAEKKKPWAKLAVNVEDDFEPLYVVPTEKKKVVTALRKAVREAGVLYLATDEDREGESIAWHLSQVLARDIPKETTVHRLAFHEITRPAITRALAQPRQINERLVQAQEARRVLDRLVGYTVSPLLWKKVAPRLSAGRVQSVAVRLLVLRERERRAFVGATWWDIEVEAAKNERSFAAQLIAVDSRNIATGKDFDDHTGRLKEGREGQVVELTAEQTEALAARLHEQPLCVTRVDRKEFSRNPYPPFTTSTLQQEANRKLGLHTSETMRVAQQLYEKGHITYMRTDSVNLADEAVAALRQTIEARYGSEMLSPQPRRHRTKSKGAQEAHEAIRPAGTDMPLARDLGLSGREASLYDLIWKRAVATQMADARLASTTVLLEAADPDDGPATFRARGQQVIFPGFLRAYVEGSDDPSGALDTRDTPLPALQEGDRVEVRSMQAQSHETRPPARYTEASLVKALETQGIGRPSTYATIIDTIQKRGYVRTLNKTLAPTFTAMAVTRLLEETLGKIVDVEFTAGMEEWLDRIAVGGDPREYLRHFYRQDLLEGVRRGEEIDARRVCTLEYDTLGPYRIRVGRYGPYVRVGENGAGNGGEGGGEGDKAVSIPEDLAPADVTEETIRELIVRAQKGEEALGVDPATGQSIYVRSGRFGPYVQLGEVTEEVPKPKRASLPRGTEPAKVDLATAIKYLSLPREIGTHPKDGEPIVAGIGRFGPYVRHGDLFASLRKGDDVLGVGLDRAVELIELKRSSPRRGRFGRKTTKATGAKGSTADAEQEAAAGEPGAAAPETAARPATKKKAARKKVVAKKTTRKKATARKVARKKATGTGTTGSRATRKKTPPPGPRS